MCCCASLFRFHLEHFQILHAFEIRRKSFAFQTWVSILGEAPDLSLSLRTVCICLVFYQHFHNANSQVQGGRAHVSSATGANFAIILKKEKQEIQFQNQIKSRFPSSSSLTLHRLLATCLIHRWMPDVFVAFIQDRSVRYG